MSLHSFIYIDVDECSEHNGGCSHYCTNGLGTYSCHCRSGYSLAYDGHICVGESMTCDVDMFNVDICLRYTLLNNF